MTEYSGIAFVASEIIHPSRRSVARLGAYVLRRPLRSEVTGERFRPPRSREAHELLHAEVVLPAGADPALAEPARLIAAMERGETVVDRRTGHRRWRRHGKRGGQACRHTVLALPDRGVTLADRLELARRYARHWAERGCAVLIAIHSATGKLLNNPHCHLLISTRRVLGSALGGKVRELNPAFARKPGASCGRVVAADGLRHLWRSIQDTYFAERGLPYRVAPDRGTPEDRGCERGRPEPPAPSAAPAPPAAPPLPPQAAPCQDDNALEALLAADLEAWSGRQTGRRRERQRPRER
jgi:hypothetical protein